MIRRTIGVLNPIGHQKLLFNGIPRLWKRGLLSGETKTWVTSSFKLREHADVDLSNNDEIVNKNSNKFDGINDGRDTYNNSSNNNPWNPAPRHHVDAAKIANEISTSDALQLWKSKFNRLVYFYNTVGYIRSEIEIARKDPSLMIWLERQRYLHKAEMNLRESKKDDTSLHGSILSQEKIDLMNSVHFQWTLMDSQSKRKVTHKHQWLEKFRELEAFKKEHGHCNPSLSTHKELNLWLNRQRNALKTLEKDNKLISLDEIQLLESLGISWGSRGDIVKRLKSDRHSRLNTNNTKICKKSKAKDQQTDTKLASGSSVATSHRDSVKNIPPNIAKGNSNPPPDTRLARKHNTAVLKDKGIKQKRVVVVHNRSRGERNNIDLITKEEGITFKRKGVVIYYGPVKSERKP